jgi:hypothetical protein
MNKVKSQPINVIKVSRHNEDCGIINLIPQSIDDKELFICYGNDPYLAVGPIVEIALLHQNIWPQKIFTKNIDIHFLKGKLRGGQKNYECDKIQIGDYYLCFIRENNAPKEIDIQNFKYDLQNLRKVQIGHPLKVSEVIASSSSVSTMVKISKKSESSLKKVSDFGASVSFNFKADLVFYGFDGGVTTSARLIKTSEEKKSKENYQSTSVECVAAEKKVMKCISSIVDYQVQVPYTADLIAYDYQGKQIVNFNKDFKDINPSSKGPVKIQGVFDRVTSGNIMIKTCCMEGCCEGNETKENDEGRPQCVGSPQDLKCTELDKCFDDQSAAIPVEDIKEESEIDLFKKQTDVRFVNYISVEE